jgi:RNA-dependent RNA polymerase
MDVLQEAAENAENAYLKLITDRFNTLTKVKDQDLIAPWQDSEARVKEMLSRPEENIRIIGQAHRSAMEAIKMHVVRVFDWCATLMKGPTTHRASTGVGLDVGGVGKSSRAAAKKGKSVKRGGAEFTHRSIETRQDFLRRMSREFVSGPPAGEVYVFSQEEVARLRASYAYLYDWTKQGGSRFPWNVAFNELGEIKLRAQKDFKPISRDFYERMSIRRL